jgi:phenylacetate-CoA ligase
VSPHFQLIVEREQTLDTLEVMVEGSGVDPEAVKTKLKSALGLSVSVIVSPDGTVPRSEGGKLNRVLDRR